MAETASALLFAARNLEAAVCKAFWVSGALMRAISALIRSSTSATQLYSALPLLLLHAERPTLALAEAAFSTVDASAGRSGNNDPKRTKIASSAASRLARSRVGHANHMV